MGGRVEREIDRIINGMKKHTCACSIEALTPLCEFVLPKCAVPADRA